MNSQNEISELFRDMIYAHDHHLLENDVGRAAILSVQHGISDPFVCDLIQSVVRKHKIARAFAGPYELPKLNYGNLILGIDQHGKPIRIHIQNLNGHSVTIGGTGSGKTYKFKFEILQIAGSTTGQWYFDLVKLELAFLKPYLAKKDVDLLIVPARKLRLNPLQCPEHVSPSDWAPRITDILVQTLQLPPRATKLLHVKILEMYLQCGIFEGSKHYPTLFDLRETIGADHEANHPAKQAVIDSLDPVLMSIGDVLQYRVGWTTKELAKRHIVFELGGIAEVDKNLILNSIVFSEFASRIAQGISNPNMDLWIVLDEAARLASSTNQSGGISELIRLIRGVGIGLNLSVQSADLAQAIMSNTANKFIGRCGSAQDYDAMSSAMGLTQVQRRWLNTNLCPGMFVGQIGEGSWRRPFVFKIPYKNIDAFRVSGQREKTIDLGDLESLPTVIAQEFEDWQRTRSKTNSRAYAEAANKHGGLSEAEIRYILAVVNNPGKPSSHLPKLARISSKSALKIRSHLVELGYLREHQVSTGLRGRTAVVLEPLELAIQLARDMERIAR